MNKKDLYTLGVLVAALIIIGGVFTFMGDEEAERVSPEVMMEDMNISGNVTMDHGAMHTETIEALPGTGLNVSLYQTYNDTADIRILPENFTFAPEHANGMHIVGEGHAHVYVDDVKVGRAYGEWFHIPNLSKGDHRIKVTLNTNDHHTYALNGVPLEKEIIITIK